MAIEHCPVHRNRDLNDIFMCYYEIHNLNIAQVAQCVLELYTLLLWRVDLRFKYRMLPSI